MIVSIIVAIDRSGGIGKGNQIPWKLSDDLKHFKRLTMGHHLIMGRKTYESIGKSLPGRTTIVLTRNPDFQIEDGYTVHSLEEAIELAESCGENEAFIVGGGEIYQSAIDLADRIYLTQVDAQIDCDVFFPTLNENNWTETYLLFQDKSEANEYPFTISLFKRKTLT
jgi:dihydrofolate reductase